MQVIIKTSNRKGKKFMAIFSNGKKVHFGSSNHSHYQIHKNNDRKQKYLNRHRKRENWTKSGMYTAGFFSRWYLWESTSYSGAAKILKQKFNITIIKKHD